VADQIRPHRHWHEWPISTDADYSHQHYWVVGSQASACRPRHWLWRSN